MGEGGRQVTLYRPATQWSPQFMTIDAFLGDTGRGDYTRERDQILPDWTLEETIQEADRLANDSVAPDDAGEHGAAGHRPRFG